MTFGAGFDSALAAAKAGEDWAWAALYRELAGPVTGYLRMRGAAEPEDLTSETFLQVAKGIHSFSGDEASFRSWVFVIAHRRLIDARRKAGRKPKSAGLGEGDGDLDRIKGGDVESDAMERLGIGGIDTLLGGLTDDQKEVLLLRVVADLSVTATAEVMGRSEGAVRVLQHRALETLRHRTGNPT